MTILDLYREQAAPTGAPLAQLPSTAGERFTAEMGAQMAPDRYFNLESSRRDWYQKINDQFHAQGMPTLPIPMDPVDQKEIANGVSPFEQRKRREQAFIDATRGAAETNPDQILAENIDRYIGEAGNRARQRAGELEGTGNGVAAFVGGMVAPTPENILGLMIPPSRAVLGAVPIARSFLFNVGREALFQGAANAGLTAVGQALDVTSRQQTGTAPSAGEVAANIGTAAAGGAVLGGAFHALHLAPRALWEHWNRLPETVRAAAPLEVRDAMHLIEGDVLYSSRNRLGLPPEIHERYQGNALDAVLRGRPPDLSGIRPPETDTALGTILRNAPGATIETPRPNIDLLPQKEILSFLARESPQEWARLGEARGELAAVSRKIEKIEGDPAWVVAQGVPDKPTQRVIDDLEQQLKTTRSDATRQQIEERLEGIRESLTPATQRERLLGEREELSSEVDALMRKFSSRADEAAEGLIDMSAQFEKPKGAAKQVNADITTPDDLKAAVQRADFDRQVRQVKQLQAQHGVAPVTRETAAPKAPEDVAMASPELEAAATSALEGKNLGDFKRAALRELAAIDEQAKDAAAALKCAGVGATA